jgi:N-acetylmuramoyl-L-alanine amidase
MLRTLAASALVVVCSGAAALVPAGPAEVPTETPPQPVAAPAPPPLAGRLVVIDPGHQLGNRNFPDQVNRLVPAGGFRKPCNTVGTSTRGGFPEATLNIRVARVLRDRLEALGAEVRMTRARNSEELWGPCVDERGRFGNAAHADLKISLHGDGSTAAGARGFHVIRPTSRVGWTDDIAAPSRRLARAVRAGLREKRVPVATYTAGGDGLVARGDLGTLNLSDVPTVLVELGNMKNRSDARRMTTRSGRATYAAGLLRGIRAYLR